MKLAVSNLEDARLHPKRWKVIGELDLMETSSWSFSYATGTMRLRCSAAGCIRDQVTYRRVEVANVNEHRSGLHEEDLVEDSSEKVTMDPFESIMRSGGREIDEGEGKDKVRRARHIIVPSSFS
jgi:hypothetical protein